MKGKSGRRDKRLQATLQTLTISNQTPSSSVTFMWWVSCPCDPGFFQNPPPPWLHEALRGHLGITCHRAISLGQSPDRNIFQSLCRFQEVTGIAASLFLISVVWLMWYGAMHYNKPTRQNPTFFIQVFSHSFITAFNHCCSLAYHFSHSFTSPGTCTGPTS